MEAIEALEAVLSNEKYTQHFSNTFEASCHAVFRAESISSKRQQLIDHLEEDLDDYDNGECRCLDLDTLLVECELQDCKLEYRVRQVLRLGLRSALHHVLPQDVDIPVVTKKTVRFDLAEYFDEPKVESTRCSDGLFVHDDGVVCL